ncbi:MAG: GNAT family protein [Ignavibacteriota bacterium]
MTAYPTAWPVPVPPVELSGTIVTLETLTRDHFAEILPFAQTPEIWRYLTTRPQTPEHMESYLEGLLSGYASGVVLPFAVRLRSTRQIVGITRFKSLTREHRKAIVGSWYAPSAWGSGCNTEGKFLLMQYGFESLGCLRIEFQVDSRNQRSCAALAKLGATQEGILRSYIISSDGHRRDSVIFSVLDTEWPEIKEKLRQRLETQLKSVAQS